MKGVPLTGLSKVRARTWATVVRRCGWSGGCDAADAADARVARITGIGILATERMVSRRRGLSNAVYITLKSPRNAGRSASRTPSRRNLLHSKRPLGHLTWRSFRYPKVVVKTLLYAMVLMVGIHRITELNRGQTGVARQTTRTRVGRAAAWRSRNAISGKLYELTLTLRIGVHRWKLVCRAWFPPEVTGG